MPLFPIRPSAAWRRLPALAGALSLLAVAAGLAVTRSSAEEARLVPPPAVDESADSGAATETAVLAGGCFWGVQGVFQHVKGVTSAISGYAGGDARTAQYETVSGGDTGHAESVKITYDPHQISYGRILYRSAIFPADAEQARVAKAYVDQLNQAGTFDAAIVTKIEPGRSFYPAEDYHQDYLTLHPTSPYIAINDLPKVEALQRLFPASYRADPVLVSAQTN